MRSIRILALAACLGALASLASAQTTHVVNQTGFQFVPDTLTIAVGDTVQWVWSGGPHTVTSGAPCTPDGLFDMPLTAGSPVASFTFTSAGSFEYFCLPHCLIGMDGVVQVAAPVPALPSWSLLALVLLLPALGAFAIRRR